MPADLQEITVQRIFVRNGMSMDLADRFLVDMATQTDFLERLESPMPTQTQPAFHH